MKSDKIKKGVERAGARSLLYATGLSREDMGKPFNAMQIRVHFTKEVPPIGTQLVTLSSAQAAVAAREEYHDAYVDGVMERYAELGQRITQLEAVLVLARETIVLSRIWHSSKLHKEFVWPRVDKALASIDALGVK